VKLVQLRKGFGDERPAAVDLGETAAGAAARFVIPAFVIADNAPQWQTPSAFLSQPTSPERFRGQQDAI
jgi:hypothetical protein